MKEERFSDLWNRMTPEDRKFTRAEMETEMIRRLPPAQIFHCSEAALHRAAHKAVSDLIDRSKRDC